MNNDEEIINQISTAIRREIPKLKMAYANDNSFGVKYEGENVIALCLPSTTNPLPNNIGDLKHLRLLNLINSSFTKVPESITELENLEILSLQRCKLDNFPEFVKDFKKLRYFDLYLNEIPEIPEFIGDMTGLINFNITRNKLTSLPESIGGLVKLETLDIAINELEQLPNGIGSLKTLKSLSAYQCELTNLPDSFCLLENLEMLWLSNNKITRLPENFGNLRNLREMEIFSNQLSELPESFSRLKNLTKLRLDHNKFKEIPTVLWPIKNLGLLALNDNPLSEEEMRIAGKFPQDILEYLRKKVTLRIFISHTVDDFNQYKIKDLSSFLENQQHISDVFICEEELVGNIDQWMAEFVPKSDLLLFIATHHSIYNSRDCRYELDLAKKFTIPIAFVKGIDIIESDLQQLDISPELVINFTPNLFEQFCIDLYKKVESFKEGKKQEDEAAPTQLSQIYIQFREKIEEIKNNCQKQIEDLNNQILTLKE